MHLEDLPATLPDLRHQTLGSIEAHLTELRRCLDGIALLGDCPRTTRHRVLAMGERMALPLVRLALNQHGLAALGVDGSQLLRTGAADDPTAGDPEVDMEESRHLTRSWYRRLTGKQVPVVTGFVAADQQGRTTTLGRGASDLTATLLGSFLEAERVEIWTDVDGVLSASPQWVEAPRRLPHLSYAEATEMARFGARVLHPRTLEPLSTTGTPVCIRNTLEPRRRGTQIGPGESRRRSSGSSAEATGGIRAISACTGNVLIQLAGRGLGRELSAALDAWDIEPLLWVRCDADSAGIVFTAELAATAMRHLRRRCRKLGRQLTVEVRHHVGLVAAIGDNVAPTRIAGKMLEALRDEDIDSLALALPGHPGRCPTAAVTVLVDDADLPRAVRRLHWDLVLESSPTEKPSSTGPLPEIPPLPRAHSMSLRRAQSKHEPLIRLL